MDKNPPTYTQLALELAQTRLDNARLQAAYNLLHAATCTVAAPAYLPGPRWQGDAH